MEQKQRLQAAHYRLAHHYLDKLRMAQRTYQQGNENVAYALALFDREREQVKQWQAWAANLTGQDEKATAFCSDYAEASPDIFRLRLPYQERLIWLKVALEAARQLGNQRAEAAHLLGLCVTSEFILEYQHASDYAQQALSIARQIDDRQLIAQSLNLCANAPLHQRNFAEAQTYYEQSLALYRAIGDQRGMAEIFNNLGMLALFRWDNAAAQDYLEQGLSICQEISNQEMLAPCLNNLGFLAIRLGKYAAANDYLEQTLALTRVMGDMQGISAALKNLGYVAYYQEEYSFALDYLEQSLVTMRAAGFREMEASCLYSLGKVTMAQEDLNRARDYFEQSIALNRSTTISTHLPESLGNLAIVYLLLHQEDLANAALYEGLEIASNLSALHPKFMVLIAATQMWVRKGKPLQAARWLGLVENHPDPSVKMTDIQKDLQIAHAECVAAFSPEQFAAAWEQGKALNLDTVIAEILSDLS